MSFIIHALSQHKWSMLILAWTNVWTNLCFYSNKRLSKEPSYCETYSVEQVIETWWVSLHTITEHLKRLLAELALFFYLYRRLTKQSCFYDTFFVIETWWVSLYTITVQWKPVNFGMNQYLNWPLFHKRWSMEPSYCETFSVEQVIETWWVLSYTITAHLKHVNTSMNQCLSWPLFLFV